MTHNRTWAEIDLGALRHNFRVIRRLTSADVMSVVKADGYGHGALRCVEALLDYHGAEWFGVATVDEGVALRNSFPDVDIIVFSPTLPSEAEAIVENRLSTFVGDFSASRALSAAVEKLGGVARLHIEFDTGMGRSGVLPDEARRFAEKFAALPQVSYEGAATHFSAAESDPGQSHHQLSQFNAALEETQSVLGRPMWRHCANSGALLCYPESHMDLVRPGLLLYGLVPELPPQIKAPDVKPVMALKTRIALIRDMPAGHGISYGSTHKLSRPSKVATLPVGYGDGYARELSNKGHVLIHGQRAPILGRVCMDMTVVDVTDIPRAAVGDEVVLIGAQGEERIRAEEIARLIGTTEHDVTTRVLPRVSRVYLEDGR